MEEFLGHLIQRRGKTDIVMIGQAFYYSVVIAVFCQVIEFYGALSDGQGHIRYQQAHVSVLVIADAVALRTHAEGRIE